jgi:hypothetical protein
VENVSIVEHVHCLVVLLVGLDEVLIIHVHFDWRCVLLMRTVQ